MKVIDEAGMGRMEIFPLPTDEATLLALFTDLFQDHWSEIRFGPLIQGAVFEIAAPQAPEGIGMLDGYLTVDFGAWHFHLCIGEHRGSRKHPVDPALAQHRRTQRAELYRIVNADNPVSWGVRLFNGAGEQQITIMLPNPLLTPDMKVAHEPDWSRLALWDHLRERFLQLAPEPRDRSAQRFVHC